MRRWLIALLFACALVPAHAFAQGSLLQAGPPAAGQMAMYSYFPNNGFGQGVVQAAGGASGGAIGLGLTEWLQQTRAPGTGPYGSHNCAWDTYAANPAGAHYICFDAQNASPAGALIAIGAVGAAAQNPLYFAVNGSIVEFPGNGQGNVLGPVTSTPNEPAVWNNTTGTLLRDGLGASISHNGNFSVTNTEAIFSSVNSLYFPSFAQTASMRNLLTLSGTISDASGGFVDAFYSSISDSDVTSYSNEHVNYAGRFAAFGPNTGTWQTGYKNIVALNAYCLAATSSNPSPTYAPGCSGINTDAFQYGSGIGDNEFGAHNLASGSGGIGHSVSLAGIQGFVESSFAAADSTHTAYAVLASNIGTQKITADYGYSGAGTAAAFIDAGNATVEAAAIYMPHSGTGNTGGIIDYGTYNGAPAGGFYTFAAPLTNNGQFGWVDSGVIIATIDASGMLLFPGNGDDGYGAEPANSGTGGIAYYNLGTWANGFSVAASTITDAAIVLQSATVAGSLIRYDSSNYTDINSGTWEWHVGGSTRATFSSAGLFDVYEFGVTQSSPTSSAACTAGQFASDTGYLYTCASTGVWKRVAVSGGY